MTAEIEFGAPRLSAKIQAHAGLIVALLTMLSTSLGALTAYYGLKAASASKERDRVSVKATDLRTEQADLASQLDDLKAENADLRQRLEADTAAPGAKGSPLTDVPLNRPLRVPLPADGQANILLDRGEVTSECCGSDLIYSRNEATGIPELTSDGVAYSVDVPSAAATEDECVQAVRTSPTITPIRNLSKGTLICATSDGGTSLLRVSAEPAKSGTRRIVQTFWPA
jgi:hypothetical protein